MPLRFNGVLRDAGFDPGEVRLIRHQDGRASPGRSPYELWRNAPEAFMAYQSSQGVDAASRKKFGAPHWAVFVADPFGDTLFVGLFAAAYRGPLEHDRPTPHVAGETDPAGSLGIYDLEPDDRLADLAGRLVIDWGPGERAWVQYADRQDKAVLELRPRGSEPPFPGYLNFIEPLSRLGKLPRGWVETLRAGRGVYLLTCPRTGEQYVGSADGADGFWGRWANYAASGHGGNVGLMSREPSDYQAAVLEVAGSAADRDAILAMEGRWQRKLQSPAMGLNRNLAKSA